MPQAQVNGITLYYETHGDPKNPPLVLIMGLASQLVRWPLEFCELLTAQGLYVIRLDNRDIGLSTQCDETGAEEIAAITKKFLSGEPAELPYSISDMASDAVGLMDHLGLAKAHICGLSMGGMIAQAAAIEHPGRVLSLTSMHSSPSNPQDPSLPRTTPEATERLLAQPPEDREGYIRHTVDSFRIFASNSPVYDPECEAQMAADQFDRGLHPMGVSRQFLAATFSRGRLEKLRGLKVPALVIHGDADALIPPEHGKVTAEAIPGARLIMMKGVGHGMAFPSTWEETAREIAALVKSV